MSVAEGTPDVLVRLLASSAATAEKAARTIKNVAVHEGTCAALINAGAVRSGDARAPCLACTAAMRAYTPAASKPLLLVLYPQRVATLDFTLRSGAMVCVLRRCRRYCVRARRTATVTTCASRWRALWATLPCTRSMRTQSSTAEASTRCFRFLATLRTTRCASLMHLSSPPLFTPPLLA